MKYDEFSFFNQQLAAMLRDGIPLEGALHRLCAEMRSGSLRDELEQLVADLAKGTPIAEALKARQLPELYKRMVLVGVKSGDLPGALTMLADYLQQQDNRINHGLSAFMLFSLHPGSVYLEQSGVTCRLQFHSGGPGWLVDVTSHSWPRVGRFFNRRASFTCTRTFAVALAGLPGGKSVTRRFGHMVDVEKWGAV
jgi:hypothetical protein